MAGTLIPGLYDEHKEGHNVATTGQLTLFIAWTISLAYFFLSTILGSTFTRSLRLLVPLFGGQQPSDIEFTEYSEGDIQSLPSSSSSSSSSSSTNEMCKDVVINVAEHHVNKNNNQIKHCENITVKRNNGSMEPKTGSDTSVKTSTGPPPTSTFDEALKKAVLFGLIMMYYYLCDYRKILPVAERVYNADQFLFLVFLLFLVGCFYSIKPTNDKILNRDQTEEWKGWMQVMFVWYHYFMAKSWYNWIRIYIAAYVWMTGFGNFSFFYVRKDFSFWRVIKMLFRLNFLVVFVCITVDNPYMLYYICAMHTYWFLSVYAVMAILPSWNCQRYKMAAKLIVYAIANAIMFEIPGVHMKVFKPFKFIFQFVDGKHDPMHEWAFRSGLDHWACFVGMICAYNYPHFERLMLYLESKSVNNFQHAMKNGIKIGIVIGCILLSVYWHQKYFILEKYTYNRYHPYTSWIPILVFIILRNIHPVLRTHYVDMFAWLGKITLETYISQLHIYLQSNAKELIGYIAGYPLLTFSLATVIYLVLSHQLFQVTNVLSSWLFPKNYKEMFIKIGLLLVLFFTSGLVAYIIKSSAK